MSTLTIRAAALVGAGTTHLGPATVIVDGGVIADIVRGHPSVPGAEIGDGTDTVTPGLIDVHTHGAAGVQVIDGDVDALRQLGAFYAAHGVTSYLATVGGSDGAIRAGLSAVRELVASDDFGGATCLGAHLEGPYISSCCPGAFDPTSIVAPDPAAFERYAALAAGTLRHVTLAPELAGQAEVIRAARDHGVTCSAGHSAATEAEMLDALDRGVAAVTHMFNAMAPLHHRDPGIVGVALTDPRLVVELIADGVHVHPRVVDLLHRAVPDDRIALVTDSIAATGLPDGDYAFEEQQLVVRSGEARLHDGTLAGSTLTLDAAVRNFAEFTGIEWTEAVVAATATPAALLGLRHRKGQISVGHDADLTGFGPHGEVRWTVVAGRLVYEAAR